MPTLPIVPPATEDGGELVVEELVDVLGLLPIEVRRILSAPVRDALASALLAILLEYQSRATQGASLGNILTSTGSSLDGLAADYDRYREDGESDASLRARILTLDAMVTPNALIDLINSFLSPYTTGEAKYFESELDQWFVHDGAGDWAWDSFVYDDEAAATPHYPDRLYADDAVENGGVSISNREVLGAWAFGDTLGRYFVIRIPDLRTFTATSANELQWTVFPSAVVRPRFHASEQLAVSGVPPKPNLSLPTCLPQFPSQFEPRRFLAAEQMSFVIPPSQLP